MSELSYLEKLLDGVDVEWKALDDVGEFLRGKRFVKSDIIFEGIPCIHYGELYTHYGIWAEETKSFLDEGVAKKLRVANCGDVVIVAAGETIEDIGNGTAWLGKNDVVFHDACFSFKSKLNPKYISYYLRTHLFKEQIKSSISSGKISSINAKGLGKAQIPIPCPDSPKKSLAIQSKIVRVLDKFTALTAELTSELTAELTVRKKQYNYYHDQLLSFDEEQVEWKALGDIAEYSKTRISFEQLDKNNYVGVDNLLQNRAGKIHSSYVPTSGNFTEFREGDILIGNIRPYLKKIWQADSVGGTNGDVLVIRGCNKSILPRYLYQILADDKFFEYNMQHAKGAKMPRGNKEAILKYRIPIPSFNEQTRIVTILDKFDTLTNSINEGLPREIELRQKQYEYYRDLLFSFPKPETANN
ncbi:TPA: restriction endonuclease subunit S [Enterobacter soli]|nr:restriction endonuclease subunit S [Enterobacter soli]